eukprot:2141066-Prymnesium_polylepis.1
MAAGRQQLEHAVVVRDAHLAGVDDDDLERAVHDNLVRDVDAAPVLEERRVDQVHRARLVHDGLALLERKAELAARHNDPMACARAHVLVGQALGA